MKIVATAREILKAGEWEEFCKDRRINEWAINEGLMDGDETFEFTIQEALKYKLMPRENYR